jgi:dTMP kinase
MYIVIEGAEATSKTTQATILASRLISEGYKVMLTKEPGSDDPICKQVRSLLLNPETNVDPDTSLCLFLADRSRHMIAIKEALDEGKIVISDRSSFSSFVYYAAAQDERSPAEVAAQIAPLLDFAQKVRPDWGFICNANFEWSKQKLNERAGLDRIEQLGETFHKLTHKYFQPYFINQLQSQMRQAPDRVWFCRPTNENTKEQLHQEIYSQLAQQLSIISHS